MRVKKEAKLREHEITCKVCGSELQYTYRDILWRLIKRKQECSFLGETDEIESYINCPICRSKIDGINTTEIVEEEV